MMLMRGSTWGGKVSSPAKLLIYDILPIHIKLLDQTWQYEAVYLRIYSGLLLQTRISEYFWKNSVWSMALFSVRNLDLRTGKNSYRIHHQLPTMVNYALYHDWQLSWPKQWKCCKPKLGIQNKDENLLLHILPCCYLLLCSLIHGIDNIKQHQK